MDCCLYWARSRDQCLQFSSKRRDGNGLQWIIILDATPPTHEYRYPSAITTNPVAYREHAYNTRQSRAIPSRRALSPITSLLNDVNKRDAGPPMTSVYSRSPLHLINMQSTQRPSRRRTTRHLFNDEDEPPAKRSKLEENTAANGGSKQANGKASAPKAKRPKRGTWTVDLKELWTRSGVSAGGGIEVLLGSLY